MKAKGLLFGAFAVWLAAAGCGANTVVKVPPAVSCRPSSQPEFAYVLDNSSTASSSAVNTVSIYTINSCTGGLSPTTPATVATGANSFGAEGLAVDPSGRFAYVANLMSNATDLATISMYTINSRTGVLTPTTPATVPTGFSRKE